MDDQSSEGACKVEGHVGIAPTNPVWKTGVYLSTPMTRKWSAAQDLHLLREGCSFTARLFACRTKWVGRRVTLPLGLVHNQGHCFYATAKVEPRQGFAPCQSVYETEH